MIILGISAYHFDTSACLLKNGKLLGAISEERLGSRIKHDSSFPVNSIKFLLETNKIGIEDIDYIAIGQDKKKNLLPKIKYSIKNIKKSIPAFIRSFTNFYKVDIINEQLKHLLLNKKKK